MSFFFNKQHSYHRLESRFVWECGYSCFSKYFSYRNVFFYFLKIIFKNSTSKQFKKYKKNSFLAKKIKFFKNMSTTAFSKTL
jgi:UDP-glucose 6-dehydrogenase